MSKVLNFPNVEGRGGPSSRSADKEELTEEQAKENLIQHMNNCNPYKAKERKKVNGQS